MILFDVLEAWESSAHALQSHGDCFFGCGLASFCRVDHFGLLCLRVSFQFTRRLRAAVALALDEAKAAFRAEYLAWKGTEDSSAG
jgi:hypothetical protein